MKKSKVRVKVKVKVKVKKGKERGKRNSLERMCSFRELSQAKRSWLEIDSISTVLTDYRGYRSTYQFWERHSPTTSEKQEIQMLFLAIRVVAEPIGCPYAAMDYTLHLYHEVHEIRLAVPSTGFLSVGARLHAAMTELLPNFRCQRWHALPTAEIFNKRSDRSV